MGYQSDQHDIERAKWAGRVVAVSHWYYDGLSDYTAMVWNEETLEVESGPCYSDSCPLSPDAPSWVVTFYAIAIAIKAKEAQDQREAHAEADRIKVEAVTVRRGKVVKVVRGRKVPKGTVATVFWVGESRWGWSVGLDLPEGRQFTALRNVEVAA